MEWLMSEQMSESVRFDYDYDGEPENGLPPFALARQHLIESISEWGDGDVLEGFNTRDMCALIGAIDRVEALAHEWAKHADDPRAYASARILDALDDPRLRRHAPTTPPPAPTEDVGGAGVGADERLRQSIARLEGRDGVGLDG